MGITIHIDASDADAAMGRLERGPTPADLAHLDAHLLGVFAETQAVVHIITGSLKMSGRPEGHYRDHVWDGTISYGGPSAGVHNPVTYALYEQRRGGAHDFMAPTVEAGPGIGDAVLDFLRESG